jgi:hypothetical protein
MVWISRAGFLGACAAGLLAGCAGPADVRSCPRTSILGIASEIDVHRPGGGEDLTDLMFRIEISGVTVECRPTKERVATTLSIALAAERGPAGQGSPWVSYFVSVVERGTERILDKQVYRGRIPFEPDQRRNVAIEEWDQVIPLPKGKLGKDYEIVVGLNLSPEQLDAARRRRAE